RGAMARGRTDSRLLRSQDFRPAVVALHAAGLLLGIREDDALRIDERDPCRDLASERTDAFLKSRGGFRRPILDQRTDQWRAGLQCGQNLALVMSIDTSDQDSAKNSDGTEQENARGSEESPEGARTPHALIVSSFATDRKEVRHGRPRDLSHQSARLAS